MTRSQAITTMALVSASAIVIISVVGDEFRSHKRSRIDTETPQATSSLPSISGYDNNQLPRAVTGWNTCHSSRYSYEIKYPPDWRVYAPAAGEAADTTCDTNPRVLFFAPDIYHSSNPIQLNLSIYDKGTSALYGDSGTIEDYLAGSRPKPGPVLKQTSLPGGGTLVWFKGDELLTSHNGTFYEFRAFDFTPELLDRIMTTFKFVN